MNCLEKAKLRRLFAVITLFRWLYNGYFALTLKGFYRHDVLYSRLR
jgi:hypothetical protein